MPLTSTEKEMWYEGDFAQFIIYRCDQGHEYEIPKDPSLRRPNEAADAAKLEQGLCPECNP